MTQDKILQIINACNTGMPKKHIDPIGAGSSVRTLLQGGKPTDRKIDEMYANVIAYQQQQLRTYKINLALAPKDSLTTQQKEHLVIQAVNAGIPKDKLNPSSHGSSINRLLQGKKIQAKTVDAMYQNLLAHLGYYDGDAFSEQKFYAHKVKCLEATIVNLVDQVQELQSKVQSLQSLCQSFTQLPQPDVRCPRKICGLTIIQKTDRVKGYAYKRWYALYKQGKKRHLIYIGNDLANAQAKIQLALARLGAKS